jgi:hypothetical protein
MIGADAALAALINQAGITYVQHQPTYMTFTETTHVVGANRSEDINRAVAVRVADDYAVMQDLPRGAVRVGQAFPVIPFFDPFSNFQFHWSAPNLKRIDIIVTPGKPYYFPSTPAPDPSVDAVVPYMTEWAPYYAPDSAATLVHILLDPTVHTGPYLYPSDVVEDPQTGLPTHVTLKSNAPGDDMVIGLDFSVIDGYWVITKGTYSGTAHVLGFMSFKIASETDFTNFAFPTTPPDPQLAGTPVPPPSTVASPSPSPSPSLR